MWLRAAVCLAFLLLSLCSAQVVDESALGDLADLSGDWRFRTGDDRNWARPDYDDSDWQLISNRKTGAAQGHASYSGFCWYRVRVTLPNRREQLSLFLNRIATSHEVYANGVLIGHFGGFPPNAEAYSPRAVAFSIPPSTTAQPSLLLAIRVWHWPVIARYREGGIQGRGAVLIGTERAIETERQLNSSKLAQSQFVAISLTGLSLLFALAMLELYVFQRHSPEYLWLGLALLASASDLGAGVLSALRQTFTIGVSSVIHSSLDSLYLFCTLQFIFVFLRLRVSRVARLYQFSLLFQVVLTFFWLWTSLTVPAANALRLLWTAPFDFALPVLLLLGSLRGDREALLLLLPIVLSRADNILSSTSGVLFQLGWRTSSAPLIPSLPLGFASLSFGSLSYLLYLLGIGAVLLYRFQYASRERERVTAELEGARQLQLSMLPQATPQLPDLETAAYMKPATEVGGDYYDFHLGADGALTIAVGDATGHGLRAGSMVTATKSLFNAFASEPDIPLMFRRISLALKLMNLRGLYMALTVMKFKDNRLTISTAGMPGALICRASTRAVEEVDIRGVPLGSVKNFPYQKREIELAAGDTVLIMSDGFPEMFNPQGQMLDYPTAKRVLAEVAHASAQEIIQEFVRVGEQWAGTGPPADDVTFVVLKVRSNGSVR